MKFETTLERDAGRRRDDACVPRGDPAKDGKMDVAGMTAGYTQFFGTKDQPNKPARTTVRVVLPAGARGGLVEIDLIAVRPK
jgi:enamine deaminase RidA (YjgF/YER057c/UK114 family)